MAGDRRGPIAWMARNPIAANLLMALFLGGGVWTALHVQKEVFPNFQLDIVEVQVVYPGASPDEVEKSIVLPVEEAIRGVQGFKEVTSTAREGSGQVTIELVSGVDRIKVFQEIDQAVSRIRTFPDDIEEPEVQLETQQRDVMEIGLYGDVDPWSLRQLAERLRDQLMAHPAITQVEISRVPDYVTHVEIPRRRLREHGLTLGEVARIIEDSSRDVPAGSLETTGGEILLRVQERKQWAGEFGKIVIVTSDEGATVTLDDLGEITDGFEETGFHGQFNRRPSVGVQIYRVGKQSPLEVAAAAREVLASFEGAMPPGVQARIDSSRADDYDERLSLLLKNGALAVLIVLAILAAFLEYRLAFWVMMGMTISFVGGMLFLPVIDVSVNMISMFAFLVVLGIVVDDAVVVGENVYEHRQRGLDRMTAAIRGTRDIARPVVFSILTNVISFVPLLFIPGETGKFWWPLPAVVIVVLLVSLFEALFILPAHLAHTSERRGSGLRRRIHGWQRAFATGFDRFVDRHFRVLLSGCLRRRYVTLTSAVALLVVVGGYGASGHMGMIMMPEVSADEIEAGVRLPVGTTTAQAAAVAREVTESTRRMFDEHELDRVAEGIKTNVRGQNFIDVEIVMKPPDQRDMSAREVIELWRDEIGDLPGVDQITFEAERGPGGWRQDISVDLSHADIEVLERASRTFLERMEGYEDTRDVSDDHDRGKEQFDLRLRPAGRVLGLTPGDVGRQVRDAFYGALAMRQLRGTNEIEVRVKLPKHEREDLHHFEDFVVLTPSGTEVPLLDVAEVERGEAYTSINRRNGRRIINVGMDVEPKRAVTRVLQSIEREELPRLRGEFPGLTWSFQGSQAEMRESTRALWGGFALAMAVVYGLLAVAFRSYLQPLIVMTAIPFGIVGAVIGHILLGYDLSLISLMGVIALSGVVVNDSLIMIDHANRHRGEHSAFEAIRDAGLRRFRPILLTTLTTFGGLTPIILESSRQAYYLIPMAISLGFGIVFATSIILLLVPSLYLILEDLKRAARPAPPVPAAGGLLVAATLALGSAGCAAPGSGPEAPALERVRVSQDGDSFVLAGSGAPFRVHGFNYDHDRGGALIESYWHDGWEVITEDFAEMRALGANVVRIHLQVAAFLDSPTEANARSLARLADLVALAERTGLRLDVTGLGCYHDEEVPAWYDALDAEARWEAQATFWEAVARTCAGSPAVFCYDLMNEPIVPGKDATAEGWLAGEFGGKHFVQRLVLDPGERTREQIVTAWVAKLAAAIRKHDPDALVTVGVIPWGLSFPGAKPLFYGEGPRAHLDFAAVHVYPRAGEVEQAVEVLRDFDLGIPVIVEEIFPLRGSIADVDAFVEATRDFCDGVIGFYWGRTPEELAAAEQDLPTALTRSWLQWFREHAPRPPDASADG